MLLPPSLREPQDHQVSRVSAACGSSDEVELLGRRYTSPSSLVQVSAPVSSLSALCEGSSTSIIIAVPNRYGG